MLSTQKVVIFILSGTVTGYQHSDACQFLPIHVFEVIVNIMDSCIGSFAGRRGLVYDKTHLTR